MCNLYLMFYTDMDNKDFFTCAGEYQQRNDMSDVADKKLFELNQEINTISQNKDTKEPKSIETSPSTTKPLSGAPFQFIKDNIGDICGTTFDAFGHIVILHRGNHRWDANTFSMGNTYAGDRNSPISVDTVITLNATGHHISSWGKDLFFLPHMITVSKR